MQAVVEIQRRLPNARVLYVSATGATEAENLCYMTRLGLWGDKTAFPDKLAFVNMLQQRGVGRLISYHSVSCLSGLEGHFHRQQIVTEVPICMACVRMCCYNQGLLCRGVGVQADVSFPGPADVGMLHCTNQNVCGLHLLGHTCSPVAPHMHHHTPATRLLCLIPSVLAMGM